jgi:heptaprenyl diphosphate synthase
MTSIHNNHASIMSHLHQLTNHPYLLQHHGTPKIPTLFITVLQLMMTSIGESSQRIITYGVSTALLRMGLVVHDQVTLQTEQDEVAFRRKQLSVLTGDYYSSLFYQTLSQHNEIAGMKVLAKTASEICEVTMKHHMAGSFDSFLQEDWSGRHLLTALADFFHAQTQVSWSSILSYLCHLDHRRTPTMTRDEMLTEIDAIEDELVRVALYQLLLEKEEMS